MSGLPPRYFSRAELRDFLEERGIALKKRWGQNFLCDPNVLRNIVSILDEGHRFLWEIGPGLGVLTAALLEQGYRVRAFEIDWGMVRALNDLFAAEQRLQVSPGDVLESWRAAWEEEVPDAIVGNLPYRSSQAILGALVENGAIPGQIVATLQKEVAERALAESGTSSYSSFSVLLRSRCSIRRHFEVSPECFYPRPEVASTVIELRPRQDLHLDTGMSGYARFVQACFRSRRKTLLNNLKAIAESRSTSRLEQLLRACDIPLEARAEELGPDAFYELYTRFSLEA